MCTPVPMVVPVPKVSIHKALVFSALTFNSETLLGQDYYQVDNSAGTGSESDPINFSLAADDNDKVINLNDVSVNVFLNALENIAALRAQNGSTMSRLEFQGGQSLPPAKQHGSSDRKNYRCRYGG